MERGRPFACGRADHMSNRIARCTAALAVAGGVAWVSFGQLGAQDGFRFRSGVELVNVTVTVTDRSGRFVRASRQPTLPSMTTSIRRDHTLQRRSRAGEPRHRAGHERQHGWRKLTGTRIDRALSRPARRSRRRVFLYGFASDVRLIQEWTKNHDAVNKGLRRVDAVGGTSMYDAVIQAVRKAQDGRNRKKAVVLISDGNDTSSSRGLRDVRRVVRESEVLVYAIGIDGSGEPAIRMRPPTFPPPPIPFPFDPGPQASWHAVAGAHTAPPEERADRRRRSIERSGPPRHHR